MKRRNFMEKIGLASACAFVPGCKPAQAADPGQYPNIVYILADDMGYGDVSALNPASKIKTPNIDRLAKEGMAFTDAHSGSAVCTPTRYGIITGRYCWRTRLKKGVTWGFDKHLIEKGRDTVASMLKRSGYNTAAIGKWHMGMDFPTTDGKEPGPENTDWKGKIENGPNANGFDYFYGISASLDMPPYIYIENDRFVGECTTTKSFKKPRRPGPAEEDFEAIDVLPTISRKTVEYIEKQRKDKPFFGYVALNAPHTPIVPTEDYRGKSGLNAYGDFCIQVDAVVGRICDALKKKGVADNTLVIFTADNGCSPMADIDRMQKQGHYPSYIYRGHKSDIFEGGHRIPFIARWPKAIEPGSECDETICLTDLYATAAAIVGASMPDDAAEDSYNILPALLGTELKNPIREATVHHSVNGSFAIRQGKWKLNMCAGSGGWSLGPRQARNMGLPSIQLYDMEKDPGETNNVYDKHSEIVERLQNLLERYKKSGRSRPI